MTGGIITVGHNLHTQRTQAMNKGTSSVCRFGSRQTRSPIAVRWMQRSSSDPAHLQDL